MGALSLTNTSEIEANYSYLARVFSEGRRQGVRIVSGPQRGFGLSLKLGWVNLPFPLLSETWNQRTLTCGVALQCSPSKDRVGKLPLQQLSQRQLRALSLVEGGVALGWVLARWPNLAPELHNHLKAIETLDSEMPPEAMLELALKKAKQHESNVIWPLLGQLPGLGTSKPEFVKAIKRLYGRMPWSSKHKYAPQQFSIPAGGDGNVQNPNLPPASKPEDDEPEVLIGQRTGIPYPEWNQWTNQFLPNHVAVFEKKHPQIQQHRVTPDPTLQRWFEAHTHRTIKSRLEDGVDVDVDQYINHYIDQASGFSSDSRFFKDLVPNRRDASTALLLDGSASLGVQQGRVFKLELACADALSRAMTSARERHGLFVFTGHTRHRVNVFCLKDFDDRTAVTPSRLGLNAGGYTRLGAPIRHLTNRLLQQRTQRRVMIIIGDGLISDEGYEGAYAWADVAHALEEAEDVGVFAYYIGIGAPHVDPLPDVFGRKRSTRISGVEELPAVLAKVHQQMISV